MGIKGTEATKEAADIVLADDNFATIERAVEEGRRIYDNIRKSVAFLLPTNGAQALIILVAVMVGIALPLAPVQILWINLVTALTLSLALAGEPAEPGIMRRPPRAPSEQVLSPRTLVQVLWTSLLIGGVTLWLFIIERNTGGSYAMAQTTAVTMLAFGQLAYLFNCCHHSSLTWRVGNRMIWYGSLVCWHSACSSTRRSCTSVSIRPPSGLPVGPDSDDHRRLPARRGRKVGHPKVFDCR